MPRGKAATICEIVLLPGPESLVAPEWVPWSDRIRPGDLGVGDVLPTPADDARLVPGMSGSDEIDAIIDRDEPRGWTGWEAGLGRARVLSIAVVIRRRIGGMTGVRSHLGNGRSGVETVRDVWLCRRQRRGSTVTLVRGVFQPVRSSGWSFGVFGVRLRCPFRGARTRRRRSVINALVVETVATGNTPGQERR